MSTPKKKPLEVDDAETLNQFLVQARRVWRAAHPEHNTVRGRPLKPDSDLALSASQQVREQAKLIGHAAAVDRWASSPLTLRTLTEKIAHEYTDIDVSTVRRKVRLVLLEEKSITALSDSDKRFLAKRRSTMLALLDEAPHTLKRMSETFLRYFDQVQRDFPTEWAMAEQRGRPLNLAEIKRLYAAIEHHPQAKRSPRSPRSPR